MEKAVATNGLKNGGAFLENNSRTGGFVSLRTLETAGFMTKVTPSLGRSSFLLHKTKDYTTSHPNGINIFYR